VTASSERHPKVHILTARLSSDAQVSDDVAIPPLEMVFFLGPRGSHHTPSSPGGSKLTNMWPHGSYIYVYAYVCGCG
jgi:hypothetical protein